MFKKIAPILISAMAFSAVVSATPVTFLEMHSTGAYVVPAGDYFYDADNSSITGYNQYSSNRTYYQNSPSFRVNYSGNWNVSFSTHELGGPMELGVYDNAVRFPFEPNGVPGISITGNGRGNNTLTGSFEVHDIAYSGNTLLRFAATFEQNTAITGRISYNSEYFETVPEPMTAALFMLLVPAVILRRNFSAEKGRVSGALYLKLNQLFRALYLKPAYRACSPDRWK